jgi:hypothetical protein
LQVCCTLLPTMGFAWLQATDVGHSAAYQHTRCEHVLLDPATTLDSRPLRALRPERDLSIPPFPEDGISVRRVPTRRQTLPFRAHHTTHPSCCHDWLQDVAILARRPGSTDPLALVAWSRRTRPGEEVRPSRSRHCCRHTKSARSTGSRYSRTIPSGAVALRSFSLVHSALETTGCPVSPHQVTLAAAFPSLPCGRCRSSPLVPTEVGYQSEARCVPHGRPQGLLPCPSPLPSHRLRVVTARCSLGLVCCFIDPAGNAA